MTTINDIKDIIEEMSRKSTTWREEKGAEIDAIKALIDDIQKKSGRPALGGAATDPNNPEVKALNSAARALIMGDQDKANKFFTEAKAMSAGSDPDGGYVVHDVISSGMTKVMAEISPIYRMARVITLPNGGAFEEPVDKESAEAAWVGELQSRDDTDTPGLANFRVELNEIYALPKISQKLIDIASINVMAWLQGKVGDAFGTKESAAYHSGNGLIQPRGILTYPTAATPDSTRAWGTFEHIATGVNGGFPVASTTVNSADKLVDVTTALRAQYRNGASWLMNRLTAGAVRKLKDAEGRHVWVDSLILGQPATLLGYPVEIDEDMPDMGTGTLSIAFGNVNKAYTIIEQPGIKFLTDPYTDKPNVKLFAYRRVGGGANNTEAIKFLKFS